MLSNHLCNVIRDAGGEIRLLADVQKVVQSHSRIVEIEYQNRKDKSVVNVPLSSSCNVIVNCAPAIFD